MAVNDTRASEARQYCDAQKSEARGGGRCELRAGHGTPHKGIGFCCFHMGNTKSHLEAGQRGLAQRAAATLGLKIEGDPGEILLQELWETASNVAFYRQLVQQLGEHSYKAQTVQIEGGPEDGEEVRVEAVEGLVGPTYHQSGIATGESKPHIFVVLYGQERDRLTKVATEALKAGVEERRVRVAEDDSAHILSAQVAALVAMGLGDRLEEFRLAFIAKLRTSGSIPQSLEAGDNGTIDGTATDVGTH